MKQKNFFETNRRNWEDRVPIHLRDTTGFYKIDAFLAGADALGPIVAAELGDVRGRRLLHLQCHIGLNTGTASWLQALPVGAAR